MPIILVGGVVVLTILNKRMSEDTWTKSFWMASCGVMLLNIIVGTVLSRPPEYLGRTISIFPGIAGFVMILFFAAISSILLRIRAEDEEVEDERDDLLFTVARRTLIITCLWVVVKAILLAG